MHGSIFQRNCFRFSEPGFLSVHLETPCAWFYDGPSLGYSVKCHILFSTWMKLVMTGNVPPGRCFVLLLLRPWNHEPPSTGCRREKIFRDDSWPIQHLQKRVRSIYRSLPFCRSCGEERKEEDMGHFNLWRIYYLFKLGNN